MSKNRRNGRDD